MYSLFRICSIPQLLYPRISRGSASSFPDVPWALISPSGRVENAPVWQDDLQVEAVVPDGAVAHRVGPAGPGGAHAADGGVRPGVDGEPDAVVLEEVVQPLPGTESL